MSTNVMYEPSLTQGRVKKTESYDMGKMFYVAFLGGTIALTGIAIANAKSLHVNSRVIRGLFTLSILFFAAKYGAYYAYFQDLLQIEQQLLKFIARAGDILLYVIYCAAMKRNYNGHLVLHGDIKPLAKPAIGWCILSIVVEMILLFTIISI